MIRRHLFIIIPKIIEANKELFRNYFIFQKIRNKNIIYPHIFYLFPPIFPSNASYWNKPIEVLQIA